MKKRKTWYLIVVLLFLILATCIIAVATYDENPYDDYPNFAYEPEGGSFLIDPATIFDDIRRGESDVFAPNLNQEQIDEQLPGAPYKGIVNWSFDDYLLIADALNGKVWKDNLKEWEIYEMFFITDCQDNPRGFDYGFMIYFKTIPYKGKRLYTTRGFSIHPRDTYVVWRGGARYRRPIFGWKSVDLDSLKVDIVNALQIAEKNGGKDTRKKFDNACSIDIRLNADNHNQIVWKINYSRGNSPEFLITIDPFTGKILRTWRY